MPTLSMVTDAELVLLSEAGDEAAFLELYRRHQGAVYRFALMMNGSAPAAEDVTQDVFVSLIRRRCRFDPQRGTLRSFLLGVARNHLRKRWARERPSEPLHETLIDVSDPHGDFERSEQIERVRRAVLLLPSRYREVVVLCDLQGLTEPEAAAVLGCPVGTVSSRLHRARARLLERLRAITPHSGVTWTRCFP